MRKARISSGFLKIKISRKIQKNKKQTMPNPQMNEQNREAMLDHFVV